MFSFFRRSKKDSSENSKRPKAITCKNNPTQDVASLPNRVPTPEFGLRENPTNVVSSEVTIRTLDQKNDPNDAPKMSENATISLLRYEPPKENRSSPGVKPCGHGTTAIMPKIPHLGGRKEIHTPPLSPKLDIKKIAKTESDKEKSTPSPVAETLVDSLVNGNEDEKKNLINQEAKFQSQLNDLSKQLSIRDAEANKFKFQMEELQRDVFAKSAGMDRLEAELQAAHKECDGLRQRIKNLENDLIEFRERNKQLLSGSSEKTESFQTYERETSDKIASLESLIKDLRIKIETLENQLEILKQEKEVLEEQKKVLLIERDGEKKKVEELLEEASRQKEQIEKKWKQDFEKHRTMNIMKEQQLLDDFEWKLREIQQTCKKRLEEKDKTIEEKLQEACKEAERKMQEAEEMMAQVETMKSYEMEIQQLKGLTVDQERSLKEMKEQHEQMREAEYSLRGETRKLRSLIELEKENLQHMQRKHRQEISDKERTLNQTLQQKRIEIAMYWEERLLRECGRLKLELEQIHNEEKHFGMECVKREKEEQFQKAENEWQKKLSDNLKEIANLKRQLLQKDEFYREEMVRTQTKTDCDILELRRLMDKIDMSHHERFEKMVQTHDAELDRFNVETEKRIGEIEAGWQSQVTSLRNTFEIVKEQMEEESQQKIEALIEQHRSELDSQWENLISQKGDAVKLVAEEYVSKFQALDEQFVTQKQSHESREIELLKTIDSLKNELRSKESALDDLQNNVDTLEGGIQVLNQEVAQQNEQMLKTRHESEHKIRDLQDTVTQMHELQEKEREAFRLKLMGVQKQSQETIDHLHRKCQCLTKLFEEVRLRYERRESRQEDLNIISDLRQVIAEQEKDLACLNEEKRYFQMRLLNLEKENASGEEETYEDAQQPRIEFPDDDDDVIIPNLQPPSYPVFTSNMLSIPPTIPECDE